MENFNWIDSREVNRPSVRPKAPPRYDVEVSQVVGFNVSTTDPKLIKLVVAWKQRDQKGEDSTVADSYLKDPKKIAELKQVFNVG